MEQPATFPSFVGTAIADPGVLAGALAQTLSQFFPEPYRSSDEVAEGVLLLLRSEHEDIEPEFNELMAKWKSERQAESSSTAIAMHPAYQRIIGLGKPALRLIFRELGKELDHWFWALRAISGEDPVPAEDRGKMKRMAADWVEWGRKNGYVR